MSRGKIYGIGVGPGDPELLTLKAVRLIREADVIASAGKEAENAVAYKIAAAAVPELKEKECIGIYMPMIRDKEKLLEAHQEGARTLEKVLDQGKNIVYLVLGDPTIYCTFSYLKPLLEADGYETELIAGVPSFCAAAARLNISLAEENEPLHVVPAVHRTDEPLTLPGTYVLMKSGSRMEDVKQLLIESGRKVAAVEKCGMDGEKMYHNVEEIPDDAGYYTLIVAKEGK